MAFRLLRAQKISADLTGKSVLITGAANGIGAATARQLSARGALVAMLDRDGEALQTAATACKGPTVTLVADVTDRADLDAAVCHLVDRVGRIDVVVANAGIVGPIATLTTVDPVAFDQVIDVDLVGVFRTLAATLPHVIDSGGYVLLVSSMAAILPTPTFRLRRGQGRRGGHRSRVGSRTRTHQRRRRCRLLRGDRHRHGQPRTPLEHRD
jgi:NAD(P)-dependent dehydrogenase (short-subunit alcohol dehydrogenase family)